LHVLKYSSAAGAWQAAYEMPIKPSGVYQMQENAWRPGPVLSGNPAEGTHSAPRIP